MTWLDSIPAEVEAFWDSRLGFWLLANRKITCVLVVPVRARGLLCCNLWRELGALEELPGVGVFALAPCSRCGAVGVWYLPDKYAKAWREVHSRRVT